MYKLLWNSKNVTNITKAWNKRENMKQKTYLDFIGKFVSFGKITLYGICEGWLNPCAAATFENLRIIFFFVFLFFEWVKKLPVYFGTYEYSFYFQRTEDQINTFMRSKFNFLYVDVPIVWYAKTEKKNWKKLVGFSPIFVADTKIIFCCFFSLSLFFCFVFFLLFFFLIGIQSMQGWTATMRHEVTQKRSTKRLKFTEKCFWKNLQLKGVC